DAFFTRSSRDRVAISWQPLTRDGGAQLSRRYSLYEMTRERRLDGYWDAYPRTWD
ncbi:MAG: YjbH domain-containing protein, partial [Halomonas sp.]|uniref:YjbH domain-containing protein n=1 Tax=Halomonas sp. TaxID=1486246 RepID=UPI0039710F64